METAYTLEGMHCSACVGKITAALRAAPGVDDVEVTLDPPVARVRSGGPLDAKVIAKAVAAAGPYRVRMDSPAAEPAARAAEAGAPTPAGSLYPLFLILGYIAGTAVVLAWGSGALHWRTLMAWFMGGFFLVFSFFKLLDWRGFADSYRTYDLVAKVAPPWGFVYPLVELSLGLAYLLGWRPVVVNAVTLVLMLIGSAGVVQALLAKRQIRCACLGTVLNLPLTQVSLVEDLGMATMAAVMLISH